MAKRKIYPRIEDWELFRKKKEQEKPVFAGQPQQKQQERSERVKNFLSQQKTEQIPEKQLEKLAERQKSEPKDFAPEKPPAPKLPQDPQSPNIQDVQGQGQTQLKKPDPTFLQRLKRSVIPEPLVVDEDPIERFHRYVSGVTRATTKPVTGFMRGRSLGGTDVAYNLLARTDPDIKNTLDDAIKSADPYEQSQLLNVVEDIGQFAGGVKSSSQLLKSLGWKPRKGGELVSRFERTAKPFITEGVAQEVKKGIEEGKSKEEVAKAALRTGAVRAVEAGTWAGLSKTASGVGKLLTGKANALSFAEKSALRNKGFKPKEIQALNPKTARTELGTIWHKNSGYKSDRPVHRLTAYIKTARLEKPLQEASRKAERARRVAKAENILKSNARQGDKAFQKSRGALKGQLPKGEVKPPKGSQITETDINQLMYRVATSNRLQHFEKQNARDGLASILRGEIPQDNQIAKLERVFGSDLAKQLLKKRTLTKRALDTVMDIANAPRSLLASTDLSAFARQSAVTGSRHPIIWGKTLPAGIKSWGSRNVARNIDNAIRKNPYYNWSQKTRNKLFLPEVETSLRAARQPEMFASRLAEKLPGVQPSQRAFINMTNKLRMDAFSKYAHRYKKLGMTPETHPKVFDDLNKVLNAGTGRGFIPEGMSSKVANFAFFSPRYVLSRFQNMTHIFQPGMSKEGRKVAAEQMASFITMDLGILSSIKYFGGDNVDVELDPRSSDFAKLKVGDTRFDIHAGYQQLLRYAAQAASGKRKSVGSERVRELDRKDLALSFARSKLSPAASFIIDSFSGSTMIGEKFPPEGKYKIAREVWERTAPLAIQDTEDALYNDGWQTGTIAGTLAMLGVGVQSFPESEWSKLAIMQDDLAQRTFNNNWDNLTERQQRALMAQHYELEQTRQKARYESKDRVPDMDYIIEQQREVAKEAREALPSNIRQELDSLQVRLPGVSRSIGKNQSHWLNDKRYKKYQNIYKGALKNSLSKLVNNPEYKKLPADYKERALDKMITEAKEYSLKAYRRWEHSD